MVSGRNEQLVPKGELAAVCLGKAYSVGLLTSCLYLALILCGFAIAIFIPHGVIWH